MTGNKKGVSLIVIIVLAVFIVLGLAACVFLGVSQKPGKLEQSKASEQNMTTGQEQVAVEATELQMDFEGFAVGSKKTIEAESETETETEAEGSDEAEETDETDESEEAGEYLCSYSSDRLMTEDDVAELTAEVYEGLPTDKSIIQMVINEMYAKYGYQFTNEEILNYFEQKTWYQDITDRITDMDSIYQQMTDIEKANIDFLRTVEG